MTRPEEQIANQLDAIGRRYWSLWVVAAILYLAYQWKGSFAVALLFTFFVSVLIWEMVIPNIGLIFALGRGMDGFTLPIRNNLALAILNPLFAVYSMAGIWKAWPYVWATLLLSALISAINGSFASGGRKRDTRG